MNKSNNNTTFVKESGFIFAMLGSAIGFANILAFSSQCYRHGGGAFLIPFIAAVILVGIPMLYLEGAIGKKYNLPLVSLYGQTLSSSWKILGWIAVLSCLTIGSFYSVLTSWSVAYTYFAALDLIPINTAHFFYHNFLKDSGSLANFGDISWPIFLCTTLVLIFSYMVNKKNIGSGVEKVCSFFLPLLFIIITFFAIMVMFLPGAFNGFYYYLYPDFTKILDFNLWRDVFGHVFFSFSLGIGIVVGYSRHTKKETDIKRAMIWVAFGDVLISIIAGFAIFGCVGFMSHKTGIPLAEIVKTDSTFEMGFIIFPQILHSFNHSIIRSILGTTFFFSVFIAGITGVFSIVESVAGNLEVEFSLTRIKAVAITIFLMLLLSLFFCMGNGTHILGVITPMVMGYIFLLGGIGQIIAFIYIDKSLISDRVFMSGSKNSSIFYMVKYFALVFLCLSLFGALYDEFHIEFDLAHQVRWGWFMLILLMASWASLQKSVNNHPK